MEGKKKGNVKSDVSDKKQELLTDDVKEEPEEPLVETVGKTSGKDKSDKGDITKKVTSARIVLTPVKIDKETVATRKRPASGEIVEPEEKGAVPSGSKSEKSSEGQPKEAVAEEKASLLKKLGLEVASGKKKAKFGGSKKGSSESDTASKKDPKSPVKSAFNKKSIAVKMGKKKVNKDDDKNDESDEEEEENSESSSKDEKRAIASPPKKSRRLRGKLDSGDEAVEVAPTKTLPVKSSPIKAPSKTSIVKSKRGLDQDDEDSDDDGEGTNKKDIVQPPKKRAKNWNEDSQEKKENSEAEDEKDVKNKTAAEKKTAKKDSGGSESKKPAAKSKKLSDKFWYMVSESEDSDEDKVEVFTPEVSSAMRARRASKLSSKLKEWGFVQGSGSSKSSEARTPAVGRGRPKSATKPKVSATKKPQSSQDDSMQSTPSTDDKPVNQKKTSTELTPVATSSKKNTMTTSTGKAASTSKTVASTTLKSGSSKGKSFTTKLGTVTMKFGTGTPKLTNLTPKSTTETPKSTTGTPKSTTGTPKSTTLTPKLATTVTSKLGTVTKLEGATQTSAETTKVALTPKPGVVPTKSGVVVSKTGLNSKLADVSKSAEKQAATGWIAKTVTVGGVTRRVVVPASKVSDVSESSKSVNVKPAAGNWVQKTMTVGTQKVIISSDGIKVLPVSSSDTEKTSKGVTTFPKSSPSAVNYIVPQSRPTMLCKSLMCKPIMMTKATTCAPIHINRSTQTEQIGEPKKTLFVPVPVPLMVPVPVPQCTMPTPYPLPMPVPVPVPCFVPTTKKLVESLMKQLQELADTLPADPLEAELLAMAELVESTKDDQGAESTDLESVTYGGSFLDKQGAGDGSNSGDMLEMAMRLASEIPDMTSEKPDVVIKVDPLPVLQMNDSHMKLKYSYGVNAYRYWVQQKNTVLEKAPIGVRGRTKLFKLDLLHCNAEELNIALCLFVKEVRKPTGEEYAADSVLYLCLGIQHYLYLNGRIDNIFADVYYSRFAECLNELLCNFEMRLNEQGVLICRVTEEHLWESRQLGAHSPKVLLNTLIYFNTKYFHLNTPEAHTSFTFVNVMKTTRKKPGSADSQRTVYLRYNASILGDQSKKSKSSSDQSETSFEQMENSENPLRCPVKLYEFYLSKCPESVRNRGDIFYLKPEPSCVPDSPVWFSPTALPTNILGVMLNRIKVVREIQEAQLNHMHQN